jgi:ABC-type dipeptide/oligopeptide/nickel transport system permease subunit
MSTHALDTPDTARSQLSDAIFVAERGRVWNRLRRHPSAIVGVAVVATYAAAALVGPFLLPFDPADTNLRGVLGPPSVAHLLGTDYLGRDELRMLIHGGRYTLALGVMAVAIGAGVGVPLGVLSGYVGGWVDLVVQRFTDMLLAFPGILLALALVAGLGIGLRNVVIAVGVSSVPAFVRLARASALAIRELPYVEAARALGVSPWRIMFRHVIPNSAAPLIVQATLQLGTAILFAGALGFLGLGVQPPTPEWGTMLGSGRNYMFSDPNLVTIPGLAIFGAVLAFNLLGDGLRDALDPRLK